MSHARKTREFSVRYCESLRDGVVVMAEHPIGRPEQKTCLCSHLCAGDRKKTCRHQSAPVLRSDKDILQGIL